jgi:hypothetical protein
MDNRSISSGKQHLWMGARNGQGLLSRRLDGDYGRSDTEPSAAENDAAPTTALSATRERPSAGAPRPGVAVQTLRPAERQSQGNGDHGGRMLEQRRGALKEAKWTTETRRRSGKLRKATQEADAATQGADGISNTVHPESLPSVRSGLCG